MRTALYARYSSENQKDASIEDQLRLCRLRAEREGWTIVDSYSDRAVSGASLLRPGIQELMRDAQEGRFDLILTEALDRLSRDQEDIAGLYKRMAFSGVRIVTLSEGEISELHIGLKGTMGALFLKDLADKTRRGLRGRVEQGKAGGGKCFGYDVVRQISADGEAVRGDRTVNEGQAAVVREIFESYAKGHSPRAIARELNRRQVPGPAGKAWGASTIHGNPSRGTGILNNELYIGLLVWNRLRFIKDPETGRRVSRPNPESEQVRAEVPHLRIVDQELWEKVRARQAEAALGPQEKGAVALNKRHRPRYLLAGLVICGRCGGGYQLVSKNLLGCAAVRSKGTCDNRLNIRVETVESAILEGLRNHLMDPALFEEFCQEFTREVNKALMERGATLAGYHAELKRVVRDLDRAIDAIFAGTPPEQLKERMIKLEARKAELKRLIASSDEPPALLHPSMAETYRKKVSALHEALAQPDTRSEAAEALRELIEAVVLVPEAGRLQVELRGHLAAMLACAAGKKKPRLLEETGSQFSLVAGVGFEPTTFRL
jgi:site-specific DNA recombinase